MKLPAFFSPSGARRILTSVIPLALVMAAVYAAACATAPSTPSPAPSGPVVAVIGGPPSFAAMKAPGAPNPDPRVGLRPGTVRLDSSYNPPRTVIATPAAEVAWNMRLLSNTPSPRDFRGQTNSDLAFTGRYAIQGNYNGFAVWDISNPAAPSLTTSYLCPASQSDVSVYKNLLFVSGEGPTGRTDCGIQGVPEPVSPIRLRGIRIFDVTDMARPRYVGNVQTCRGSHTHTVVTDPNDTQNVYIYVSGSSGVRSPEELPGCADVRDPSDPNTSLFRIEVIRVPLAAPQTAAIVSSPRIFTGLTAPPQSAPRPPDPGQGAGRAGRGGGGGGGGAAPTGPTQCHDITVYPAVGLAGGACGGYGLLLDIRNVTAPVRIDQAADSNMSFWHSANFSNDGTKILFTDEWGGGRGARCRSTDKPEWGSNALFTIENGKMHFKSYYKMPAFQTQFENCVAHNGSPIPIPGREVMVQGWYQGGISIFDWTDITHPYEIAFFDRGPTAVHAPREDSTITVGAGGSWSVYWYNGALVSSEIARGLDIFEIIPSPYISQNEIDAANTVRFEYMNAQEQPKMVWPPSFSLARAFVDQLARSNGLAAGRITSVRAELSRAEGMSGADRQAALTRLSTQLTGEATGSRDAAKVRMLASAVTNLANVR